METQFIPNDISPWLPVGPLIAKGVVTPDGDMADDYRSFFQQLRLPWLNDLLEKLAVPSGK